MPPEHRDRLATMDAVFFKGESPTAHMHVGAVITFEGPPPTVERLERHIRERLPLVPRYRQRIELPPLDAGRPVWVDDTEFNLEYHVFHAALPTPGTDEQLKRLVARVNSQQLDRSRPLWEMWFIEGLAGGRFALISKTHHAMVDGVAGVDLAAVLFDVTTEPRKAEADSWRPQETPGKLDLAMDVVRQRVGQVAGSPLRIGKALTDPVGSLKRTAGVAASLGSLAKTDAPAAPSTPLEAEIGRHRRFDWAICELAQLKAVKKELGGTVNDVVLAVVTGALAKFLRHRGVDPLPDKIYAMVPVSTRTEDQHGELGNQISVFRGVLPVGIEDPAKRLFAISERMSIAKESGQALGVKTIIDLGEFAPPILLGMSVRVFYSRHLYNTTVTNIPGPQVPLYVVGRKMNWAAPLIPLGPGHALSVGILSYNGTMNFSLTGDFDALPDLHVIRKGIEEALTELLALAEDR